MSCQKKEKSFEAKLKLLYFGTSSVLQFVIQVANFGEISHLYLYLRIQDTSKAQSDTVLTEKVDFRLEFNDEIL